MGSCFLRPVNSCAFRVSLMMLSPLWFFHTCLLQSHPARQAVAVQRERDESGNLQNTLLTGWEGNVGMQILCVAELVGLWGFILFSLPFSCSLIWFLSCCIGKEIRFLDYAECLPSAWWFVGGSKQQGLTVERREIVVELSTEVTPQAWCFHRLTLSGFFKWIMRPLVLRTFCAWRLHVKILALMDS